MDLVYLALMGLLWLLALGFVKGCARLIAPEVRS